MSDLLPASLETLLVPGLFVGIMLYAIWAIVGFVRHTAQEQQVLERGVAAEATVLQVKDTGLRINKRLVLSVLLEVRLSGRAPYQVRVKKRLEHLQGAGSLGVGMHLNVKVDPNDTQRVAIVGAVTERARHSHWG